MNRRNIAPTRRNSKKRGTNLVFLLFLLFIYGMLLCNRIEFFKLKFLVSVLSLILSGEIGMTLSNALSVSNRYEFYKFVL